ncbi:MAG: hypothetical protein AAGA68_04705 [Pseudomonadota bacterium]
MICERLEMVKSVVVGALMALAFVLIGPPTGGAPEALEPTVALVDHSPASGGEYLTQLISE